MRVNGETWVKEADSIALKNINIPLNKLLMSTNTSNIEYIPIYRLSVLAKRNIETLVVLPNNVNSLERHIREHELIRDIAFRWL